MEPQEQPREFPRGKLPREFPLEPAVTPAAEFRRDREEGIPLPLASGRVVRIRMVKPLHLLRQGTLPDALTELVLGALYGTIPSDRIIHFFTMPEQLELARDRMEAIRVVCTAALVYPRLVEHPQADDEIHFDDLEEREVIRIFSQALREVLALSSFRDEQAGDVEAVDAQPSPALPPEPPAGARRPPDRLLLRRRRRHAGAGRRDGAGGEGPGAGDEGGDRAPLHARPAA